MQTESSTIFNLAEIMRLEHDRVEAEQAAEQAARDAVERARREQIERERLAIERSQRVQARLRVRAARRAERQERERAAALLRVRLDAEARVRLQRDALELERMRAEQAQRGQARSRMWRRGVAAAALALIGAVALLFVRNAGA